MEWDISDSEIQDVERLLLPNGCHFADDALQVVRCWHSADVSACPGSGKTTVLLAKLKLLADRMPFADGAGICVLSHTNVAIKEIKKKLVGYADKLIGYPNYVGTIQSFVDKFVTLPYIRRTVGRSVQPLDDRTYAQFMLHKMRCGSYGPLAYVVKSSYENGGNRHTDREEHAMALYIRDDGALCIRNQKKILAGPNTQSAQQFKDIVNELLKDDGIIRYRDAFMYASSAIEELSDQYTSLFSRRFRYVYVDEYQDCNEAQRIALHKLFDSSKCSVTYIGDADQAIYNSEANQTIDWCPREGALSIASSCRYSQKIADVLSPLRKDKIVIHSSLEEDGLKPVLIIYDKDTIGSVLAAFVTLLENRGLHDPNGIYKAIGFVGKSDSAGISIGSYWNQFDGTRQRTYEYKYWGIIDEICIQLQQGKLYKVEILTRKLINRLFYYTGVKDEKTGMEYTHSSLRATLNEKYCEIYADCILSFVQVKDYDRKSIDIVVRNMIKRILKTEMQLGEDVFCSVPAYFMEENVFKGEDKSDKNVFVEPLHGRRIQFDTVHGVKGETHDATLYLETEYRNGSDIARTLYCYGVGKAGVSPLFDYSRKIAYVGMSRPQKLLCVAMQKSTYMKSRNAFLVWDKVDLSKQKD